MTQSLDEKLAKLNRRNDELLQGTSESGYEPFAEQIKEFAQECAQNYIALRGVERYTDADKLRSMAFIWSVRLKEVTGEFKLPNMPVVAEAGTTS